jgi:hypothetical protein
VYGVWCQQLASWVSGVTGQPLRFRTIDEAEREAENWRRTSLVNQFLVRQFGPDGRPYEGPAPVTVRS